jgi:hypothetical protein
MKGLTVCLCAALVLSLAAHAATLNLTFGGGPAATPLAELNASLSAINILIEHLNETFEAHPDVDGSVAPLHLLKSAISLYGGESFQPVDWLGLGAHVEVLRSSTATSGTYTGASVSTIDVSLGFSTIALAVDAHVRFLDMGIQLAADLSGAYYRSTVRRAVVFQIPEEYPDTLSTVPPEGEGEYTGSAFGFEAGLSIAYPVAPWFVVHTILAYRSALIPSVKDSSGTALDLDGNGQPESIELDGLTVRIGFSICIDLSLDGGKE